MLIVNNLILNRYKGLFLKNIGEFLASYPEVIDYLPDEKERFKLPKQWIVNITYTIAGDDFAEWVKEAIETRNRKVTIEKDLMIDMDPDIH